MFKLIQSKRSKKANSKVPKKTGSKKKQVKRDANFYDIFDDIVGISKAEFDDVRIPKKMSSREISCFINSNIKKHNMQVGDIMFVGSKHDRQEYGFAVVIPPKDGKQYFIGNDTQRGPYGPLQEEVYPLIKSKVSYKKTFKDIKKWEKKTAEFFMDDLFFAGIDEKEIIEIYKEAGLWK